MRGRVGKIKLPGIMTGDFMPIMGKMLGMKTVVCADGVIGCSGICETSGTGAKNAHTHKPEYEKCCTFGALMLNDDLDSILRCSDLSNRSGLDTISSGATVAFATDPTPGHHTNSSATCYNESHLRESVSWAPPVTRPYAKSGEYVPGDEQARANRRPGPPSAPGKRPPTLARHVRGTIGWQIRESTASRRLAKVSLPAGQSRSSRWWELTE